MLLKQLKQLTFSAPFRNARFNLSTALSQSLTTSKAPRRLSKELRRAEVETFVTKYRASNAGKFPTLKTIHKEVGGCYYIVRDIFQELKLKPEGSLPIVAKAPSEVSASVPNDASSRTINDSQSNSSACNAESFSSVAVDPEFQAGTTDTIETGSDQRQKATNLQNSNLVIATTHDKIETETAPNNDVDSKRNSNSQVPEFQKSIVLDERSKNSETEKEKNSTHLVSKKSKIDHLEGASISENVVPTETRQVSETGAGEVETRKKSSTWSDIMSFAKEFASFWRKG